MPEKRKDYITWDQYFMGLALLSKERSKDPKRQVGACIVDKNNKVLSIGYNGAPTGFSDDKIPWAKEGKLVDTKYPYICHAELNAILNFHGDLKNSKLYVTYFPCNECAKAIVQAGIKEVIYLDKPDHDESVEVSEVILKECGVVYRKYETYDRQIILNI